MAFCKACGADVGGAAFCPKCGANQGAVTTPAAASPTEGLQENVAGLLCYVLGWLTGLVFLLIDKRPFVKFHAAQSIVVFGALFVVRLAFFFFGWSGGLLGWGIIGILSILIGLFTLVMWILLMVKAYQHEMFRVPVAAGIADGLAK